jgi:hypothetical protein
MIDLAATLCRQAKAMAIANRTLERGEKLATRFVPRSCAWPTCPAACTSSMRHQLYRQHPAHHRPGAVEARP